MNARQSILILRPLRVVVVLIIGLSAVETSYAVTTYQIGTAESDGQFIIKGGSVETDGTLGPLSASNIVSMSVDIGFLSFVGNAPGVFEQLDGSTTLNLNNSTLTIAGLVEATPTGIRIDHATEIGESNLLTLAGNAGASVTWASSYFDLSSSFVGHLTGFSHEISVFAPPAGGILAGLPDSGVIAQAAPEPSTAILLVIGCAVAWVARRR